MSDTACLFEANLLALHYGLRSTSTQHVPYPADAYPVGVVIVVDSPQHSFASLQD
jgi:hypothetical protein